MRKQILAAPALLAATPLAAQGVPDLATAVPITGQWTYNTAGDGSEARFADAAGTTQLSVHCTRATRRVTIAKAASAASPLLNVWTSAQTRSIPVSYNPATGQLSADLQAYDTLLDNMVMSRGRIGFTVGPQPPLVVPPWPEIARVVEDCRA
jgi:hypothetical protein